MSKREKDFFYKLAKKKGVNARSYFKLEQIQSKYKIFKAGQKVFDIGCAPGSWLQYVYEIVGSEGKFIGVDLSGMELSFPNLDFYQMDIFDVDSKDFFQKYGWVDVVMSDVAPKTTGQKIVDIERSYQLCKKSLDIVRVMLKPKGDFVCKMYHGERFDDFQALMKEVFFEVKIFRPKATRKISREIFWIGKGKK
ncbi:MAG: RlmE family RNA methyltransferase [Bdellovibrionales bacterium]|nr:RlmE family RNA methyltransferase [Bdellovibrionales bacterium]